MVGTTPDPVSVLRGHHAEVQALDFLDAEHALLTGDAEGEVRAWDLEDLRPTASRRGHPVVGGVLSLQTYHWQGTQFVVTQGKDMSVFIWRLGPDLQLSREPVHSILGLASTFCRLSLLTFSSSLAAGDGSGGPAQSPAGGGTEAIASNASSLEWACPAHPAIPTAANGAAPPPLSAAAGAHVGEPAPCEPASPACQQGPEVIDASVAPSAAQHQPLPHQCSAVAAAEGPPAPLLALPAEDNSHAEVWCCGCGQRLASLGGRSAGGQPLGMLTSLKLFRLLSGQACLAAGYEGGWVAVWGLPAAEGSGGSSGTRAGPGGGAEPLAARQLHGEPVLALDMDASGAGGASAGADARLVLFKLAGFPAGEAGPAGPSESSAGGAAAVTVSVTSRVPGQNGRWGPIGLQIKVRKTVALRAAGVNDVAIRGDGRIVATAGWDGRVRVFKYRSGEPLAVLKYHQSAVACVRFSPGTLMLASASRDSTVALWSIYQSAQKWS